MGLGFGARSYTAAPPPASLLQLCRTDLPQDMPPQHAARSSAATKNKPLAAKRFPKPPPPPQLLAPPPPPPPPLPQQQQQQQQQQQGQGRGQRRQQAPRQRSMWASGVVGFSSLHSSAVNFINV